MTAAPMVTAEPTFHGKPTLRVVELPRDLPSLPRRQRELAEDVSDSARALAQAEEHVAYCRQQLDRALAQARMALTGHRSAVLAARSGGIQVDVTEAPR